MYLEYVLSISRKKKSFPAHLLLSVNICFCGATDQCVSLAFHWTAALPSPLLPPGGHRQGCSTEKGKRRGDECAVHICAPAWPSLCSCFCACPRVTRRSFDVNRGHCDFFEIFHPQNECLLTPRNIVVETKGKEPALYPGCVLLFFL